jgi:thioredoxin-like negative regulator of GroEL
MEIINANDTAFEKLLKDNNKLVVKFYAGWCGSCRLIAPKFKQLAENDAYSEVSFVEIDAEHNPIARSAAKVNNLPFFAAFSNGELVEGFPTSKIEAVESMIKNL